MLGCYFNGTWGRNLLLSCLLSSCLPVTRHRAVTVCTTALASTDKVLVAHIHPIPLASSAWYFGILKQQFDKRSISVLYAPEEEWALKSAGIVNPVDTQSYQSLLQKGFTHLLLIEQTDRQAGDIADYYTPFEVGQRQVLWRDPRPNTTAHKATLVFKLIWLRNRAVAYRGTATTTISAAMKQDSDGGERYTNLGSVDMATTKAIRRGAIRLLSECR